MPEAMSAHVAIYQLHTKFVNQREDIPEDARQVVYYTLAVGHHVGVLDCFSSLAEIPLNEFRTWVEQLPEGPARAKLEGVLRYGEIEINTSHVNLLLPLVKTDASFAEAQQPAPDARPWIAILAQCLQCIRQEPAMYLMLRKYS